MVADQISFGHGFRLESIPLLFTIGLVLQVWAAVFPCPRCDSASPVQILGSDAQIRGARLLRILSFLLVAPNMELTLRHPSGPYNFTVGLRFLENICTPPIENLDFHIYFLIKVTLILIQGSLGRKGIYFFHFLSGIANNINSQML